MKALPQSLYSTIIKYKGIATVFKYHYEWSIFLSNILHIPASFFYILLCHSYLFVSHHLHVLHNYSTFCLVILTCSSVIISISCKSFSKRSWNKTLISCHVCFSISSMWSILKVFWYLKKLISLTSAWNLHSTVQGKLRINLIY